jgi:hypothetical protein
LPDRRRTITVFAKHINTISDGKNMMQHFDIHVEKIVVTLLFPTASLHNTLYRQLQPKQSMTRSQVLNSEIPNILHLYLYVPFSGA